ncbi:MAG: TonB-dependent receptor [Burkholderiales bacterium]
MRIVVAAALAAAQVFPYAVLAQSASEADAVVITASRTEQRLRDAVPHTTVLTRREIEDSQAPDLPSLLQREAGFEFARNGGIGAVTGVFMRGGRGAQALVLVDGVRIEDAGFGTTAIQHILLDDVERVEVVRGNVSALYGSAAISGVVQIFTRRGEGAPRPSVEAMAGSRGTSKLSAGYAGRAGDTRFSFSAARFDTEGFSAIDPRRAPSANPDRDGYRNSSFSGSLSHRLSSHNEIGFALYSTDGRVEYDSGSSFDNPTDVHESKQRLEAVSGWWEARPVERWKSRVTLGQGTDFRTDRLNASISSLSNTRNRQASWDNEVRLSPEHVVSLGAEVLRQELVNSFIAERQHRDVDILRAGYLGRLGRHSVQLNVRGEDYSDFGKADTYFAGYGFDLSDAWRLVASAGSAFRAPTFQDLFGFGGDPALKPERARTKELGVQWASGPHRARLVAFDTEYQDAIAFDVATSTVRNVREASVEGAELSYSGNVSGFDLRASLTSQKAIEQEPNAQPLPAVRRAKTHGALSAHRAFGRWRLGGEVLSSGSRPDTDILTFARVQLAGYAVVNLMARYQFDRHLYVAARLENAFDEEYNLVDGYNTAGRGLFVSVGWRP